MTIPAAVSAYVERREATLARVRALLIERLRVQRAPDEIDPDTPLFGTGLGLDSIDAVELIVLIETVWGLRLPNDLTGRASLRTVNSVVDLVLAHDASANGR